MVCARPPFGSLPTAGSRGTSSCSFWPVLMQVAVSCKHDGRPTSGPALPLLALSPFLMSVLSVSLPCMPFCCPPSVPMHPCTPTCTSSCTCTCTHTHIYIPAHIYLHCYPATFLGGLTMRGLFPARGLSGLVFIQEAFTLSGPRAREARGARGWELHLQQGKRCGSPGPVHDGGEAGAAFGSPTAPSPLHHPTAVKAISWVTPCHYTVLCLRGPTTSMLHQHASPTTRLLPTLSCTLRHHHSRRRSTIFTLVHSSSSSSRRCA